MQSPAAPCLLPGLACSDLIWADQLRDLAPFRPYVVPGYGDADSITSMAQQVLASAPARMSLVGHSMGARVALEMLRLAPQRIERLALLDTGVHPVRPGEAEKREALLEIGRRHGIDALVDEWLPPMVHPRRRGDESFMRPLHEMAAAGGVARFERQVGALLGRPDAESLLGRIACPTLIGVGRQDEWAPLAQHEAMAAAIDSAQLVVFEDSGHMATVEAPEAVSNALMEWLKK